MSNTLGEAREFLNGLVSDPMNQKWSQEIKDRFINKAYKSVIASETLSYVRVAEIQIRDEEYEYDFPADMLEPLAIMMQDIEGAVVVSSSWRSLLGESIEGGVASFPAESTQFWQIAANGSGYITLRDIVSNNKFIFSPSYNANVNASTVNKQESMPVSASEGDIWVDTFLSENFVYKALENYSTTAEQASITVGNDLLAGSTDLLFTYDIPGVKYVQVVINNLGASGVSSLAITGDADDRANPLTYTYNLYEDQSSNDAIIALTTGDMTVTGSDANNGSFIDTSATLLNPSETKWEPQYLHVRYSAIFPALVNEEDEFRDELAVMIKEEEAVAYKAASELMRTMKGDQFTISMAKSFKDEYENILMRAHKHRMAGGPPDDLYPV